MIGLARPSDAAELLALYQHLVSEDPVLDVASAQERLTQLALYPGSGVFVLRSGGAIVASATLIVIPNLTRQGRPYALIENVVTHADHRRQGHGAAVMQAAINAAWQAGCYKILLMTGSRDPATHRFYEGLGFDRGKTGYRLRHPDHAR
ncbi:GNAT family N-acetyltransferase [Falsirhodobacter sp. 1013]|uniref:GNAT family N-acetyltransferase n=1 Tax=Falsirhodobacter sp. 1013 TaxID=3417566 RepID=UPI003EBEB82E